MATTPVFLPGKSHEQGSLAGYGPWGSKELGMAELTNTCGGEMGTYVCPEAYSSTLEMSFGELCILYVEDHQ